jgi:uncharacterized protein YhaN
MDPEVQAAIDSLRKADEQLRDRMKEVELKSRFWKEGMDELKGNVEKNMQSLRTDIHEIKGDVKGINATLNTAKGSAGAFQWMAQHWPSVAAMAAAGYAAAQAGGIGT